MFTYRAQGKLLLTGEYFVMEGAQALALPTRLGQRMELTAEPNSNTLLRWYSAHPKNPDWFVGLFDDRHQRTLSNNEVLAKGLEKVLQATEILAPRFLQSQSICKVETFLEFPHDWGLGSSSTLISLMAQAFGVDPNALLKATFGGSGYDIACATADAPILYRLADGGTPEVLPAAFHPVFRTNLYFLYLNQKQNSRDGIRHYYSLPKDQRTAALHNINQLTTAVAQAETLPDFERLLTEHERLVATELRLTPVKDQRFHDYWGAVKSLGAWGGDFVLATSNRSEAKTRAYFKARGHEVMFRYDKLVF